MILSMNLLSAVGYISPGHGMKGKLNSIDVDDDLTEMYIEYEVLLWCFATIDENSVTIPETQKSRKRSRQTASANPVDSNETRTTSKRVE